MDFRQAIIDQVSGASVAVDIGLCGAPGMMHEWRPQGCCWGVLCVSILVCGCNRENAPGLGRVSGTVTMDGSPVADAAITFEPQGGTAGTSLGRTDTEGKYELYYSRNLKGAATGEHVVRINTYREVGDDKPQIIKETIPSKYNVKSELKVKVTRGSNQHDFALESKGEVIQPYAEEKTGKKKGKKTGCM
jgi:hypothetical protein